MFMLSLVMEQLRERGRNYHKENLLEEVEEILIVIIALNLN